MTSIVYFGHHKCASSWTRKILFRIAAHMGWRVKTVWAPWKNPDRPEIQPNQSLIYSFGNAMPEDQSALPPDARAFHVTRNPKDLLVSAYFSHKNSHPTNKWPELETQRNYLNRIDKTTGLISTMDFIDETFNSLYKWDYCDPKTLWVPMEHLTKAPHVFWPLIIKHHRIKLDNPKRGEEIKKAINRWGVRLEWLGLGYTPFKHLSYSHEELTKDLDDFTFEKMSGGRKPGQENPNNHYRKGVEGDWVNHWNNDIEEAFNDRWSNIMEKTGYEAVPE